MSDYGSNEERSQGSDCGLGDSSSSRASSDSGVWHSDGGDSVTQVPAPPVESGGGGYGGGLFGGIVGMGGALLHSERGYQQEYDAQQGTVQPGYGVAQGYDQQYQYQPRQQQQQPQYPTYPQEHSQQYPQQPSQYPQQTSQYPTQPPPPFEYSRCSGRKKAVLVGINYFGQKGELGGCINDVHNLKDFLCRTYGYSLGDMVLLTDDSGDYRTLPTKRNIIEAMRWLVDGASRDDALFFHYSGHGTQVAVNNAAEADGLGEAICPLDYKDAGLIVDHESGLGVASLTPVFDVLVKPLPAGCRLTTIFDSCHSGTVMNLPYAYTTDGKIKEPNFLADAGKALLTAGIGYARGDGGSVMNTLLGAAKTAINETQAEATLRRENTSQADVIAWSGCKDEQTSADTTQQGEATGAMSYAFVRALTRNPNLTYSALLNAVRAEMRAGGYTQKPQLSACHPIDTELQFVA